MMDERDELIGCSEKKSRGALLLATLEGFDPEYVAELERNQQHQPSMQERKPVTTP